VLCPKCRNDNPADYRFCGMCGTPLEKPATAPDSGGSSRPAELSGPRERPSSAQPPLSGPSFLGLGDESSRSGYGSSSRDVTYLFEDEQPRRTYWRFTLVLLILIAFAGLGWLEYTRSGKSWTAPWSKGPAQTPIQASQPAPPEQNQAPPAPSQPPVDNSATAKPENAPAATTPAPAQPAPPENQPATKAASGNQAQSEAPETKGGSKSEPTEAASAEKPSSENDSTEEADTAEPAKPAKPLKAAKPKPRPAVPASSPDDALVANAEKYLYGRGVPQNCDRALSSLRAAAARDNFRARSLLGTMYATGHCVPRDLPNAYRWFALASRENADNMWVQRNLEMIWREMTPQERQLATQRSQ
jgi:hypothetical protein